ncbi:ZrgA family zinc uptake protein, partial [Vibrio genomosp. F10]|uniref:ZrgA family zinc uptake protein n=3 Tax=Vibrio genomosp. F10 TaxID=723171 RepID=UPI00114D2F16
MQIKTTIATSIGLLLSFSSLADDTFRQHDAHVHGHVEFNIAQDAHELLIEITAPGADVVGFEHQPQNEQQTEQLASAVKMLNEASNVVSLNSSAKCHIEYKSVTHTLGDDNHDHDEKHEHHDHDKHEHHDHDKHEH